VEENELIDKIGKIRRWRKLTGARRLPWVVEAGQVKKSMVSV